MTKKAMFTAVSHAGTPLNEINTLENLMEWAARVSDFMATDKNNDWSEELNELNEILGAEI